MNRPIRVISLFCLALSASLSAQDITVKAQSDVSSLATSGSTCQPMKATKSSSASAGRVRSGMTPLRRELRRRGV